MPHSETHYWSRKEPYHFCPDLVLEPHRLDTAAYEGLYANREEAHRGDASPLYLFSTVAPTRISEAISNPKIIITLRHPVDYLVSLWLDCLRWGQDDETDFSRAIAPDRSSSTLPAGCWFPAFMAYRRYAHFSRYIERYLSRFGADRVLFLSLQNLSESPEETFLTVLRFLGADPTAPFPDFAARNVNPGVRRTVKWEQRIAPRVHRLPLGHAIWSVSERLLQRVIPDIRTTIPASVTQDLLAEFEQETSRIEALTGLTLKTRLNT